MFCSSFGASFRWSPGTYPTRTARSTSCCNTGRRLSRWRPRAASTSPHPHSSGMSPSSSRSTPCASLNGGIAGTGQLQTCRCTWQGKQRICFKPPAELEVLPIPPPPSPAANTLRLSRIYGKTLLRFCFSRVFITFERKKCSETIPFLQIFLFCKKLNYFCGGYKVFNNSAEEVNV